jgi:tetratricopeptide (TPR) repeat protein
MAPEQWQGRVDQRSDQFGLCAALLEALGGAPPPRGEASSIDGARAPAWVGAVILRGTAQDPAARYADMRALVTALRRDPSRLRRQAIAVAGALALAATAAAGASWVTAEGSCAGAGERLAGVWDGAVATRLERSFAAVGLPHAARVWPLVVGRLDAYRGAWIDAHVGLCRSAERGEVSARVLDLGMACLERGRAQLDELARGLAVPDRARVNAAVDAARSLRPPEECVHEGRLGAALPPPPEAVRAQAAALGEELGRIRALTALHELDTAVSRAEAAVTTARALDYRPLLAEALAQLGAAHNTAERHASALAPLDEALATAYAARHDTRVGAILAELVRAGSVLGRDDTDRWYQLGLAAIERHGGDPALAAQLRCNYAVRFLATSRHDEHLAHAQACLALTEAAFGAEDPRRARALMSLGAAQERRGDHGAARESLGRALALIERTLGEDAPELVDACGNLAVVSRSLGDGEAALAHARRALEIKTRILGEDDPRLAKVNQNLGVMLAERGDAAGALPYFETALRHHQAARGPADPSVGESLGNLAMVAVMAGDLDRAAQYAARSLEVFERAHPGPHEHVVNAHTLIGTIERMRGGLDASLASLERAVALADRVFSPGHPQRVNPLIELGHTLAARKEHARAVEVLERAEALFGAKEVPPPWVGEGRFALARAQLSAGRDRRGARVQASRARDVYRGLGPQFAPQVAEIDAWLVAAGTTSR